MRFRHWLFNEQGGGLLFAKAVDEEGLASILKSGFRLRGRQSSASAGFSRGLGSTEEQMYGPGLYFYMAPSEEQARRGCGEYSGWGGSVVLASLEPSARVLVTSWLPESHPAWGHSAAGRAGVYDQLEALGVLDLFPEYRPGDTHVDPEWGYRLAGRISGWIHQHNTRTHLVVYDPSVLRVAGHFECPREPAPARPAAHRREGPSRTNPRTGAEYDRSLPLDRQMMLTGLLRNGRDLDAVRRIQGDPGHPDHDYWRGFRVDSNAGP